MKVKTLTPLCLLLALHFFSGCNQSATTDANQSAKIHRDTISFEISAANNIIFKTLLNGTDSVDLFFDTGGTEIVMLHDAIKTQTTLLDGKNENYQGEHFDPLEELNTLSIGSMTWDTLTIYPAPIGPEEAAGHFGWNLFEDKIVELDYDKQLMIVSDSLVAIPEGYAKLEIEYTHTLFCINGTLEVAGQSMTDRYLFDTGFQRAVVMDKDLRAEGNFPTDLPVIKESVLRNSEGTKFVNKVVSLDKICFDKACANSVPVQLIDTPNPARFKTHILGNELLKRFNTILDFKNHFVYLKENSLMDLPYKDAIDS